MGISKLTRERGTTAVEYSVLIAFLCVGLLSVLAGMSQGLFGDSKSELSLALRDPAGYAASMKGGGTEHGK